MKTTITITGQTGGNSTLHSNISTANSTTKNLRFNQYEITFKTKGEATKALSEAFQNLKFEEPEMYKNGSLSYGRGRYIDYDASCAKIDID